MHSTNYAYSKKDIQYTKIYINIPILYYIAFTIVINIILTDFYFTFTLEALIGCGTTSIPLPEAAEEVGRKPPKCWWLAVGGEAEDEDSGRGAWWPE